MKITAQYDDYCIITYVSKTGNEISITVDNEDVERVITTFKRLKIREFKGIPYVYGYVKPKQPIPLKQFILNVNGKQVASIDNDPHNLRKQNLALKTEKPKPEPKQLKPEPKLKQKPNKTIHKTGINQTNFKQLNLNQYNQQYELSVIHDNIRYHLGYFNNYDDGFLAYDTIDLELFNPQNKLELLPNFLVKLMTKSN